MSEFHEPPPFTFKHVVFWFAVFLAADFYLAANRFGSLPEADRTDATRLARGAFAAGVAAAVSLGLVMALERG